MSSIDVVVPCYRYAHLLRECVESVLSQSVAELRVLIIDDASPDNTAEIGAQLAAEDPRVTFRRHAQNQGHIATYNEGIAWAHSRYLMILSADDYLMPGAFQRAMDVMDSDDAIGLCFGDAPILDGEGRLHSSTPVVELPQGVPSLVMPGLDFIELSRARGTMNIVPTPTAVVRTSLQKRLGGYLPVLPHSGDMELWLRFAAHSRVAYVAADQAVYRRHAQNMSLAYFGLNRLSDLQQRKAAIEALCRRCTDVLPDAARLQSSFFEPLALEAVRCANAAFNAGRLEAHDQLLSFAVESHPNVRKSIPWILLACKRGLGERVWQAVSPSVARVRNTTARLFG